MHRPSYTAISFLPASEDDIPSLMRIHMLAFANDNSARLMFKNNNEYQTMLLGMLKSQLSDPKVRVIKAVTKDTGKILGWQASRFLSKNDDLESKGAIAGLEELKDETKDQKGNVRNLRSVLRKDAVRFEKDWMGNKDYIHFDTLVVDPTAQGHGVGTALVHWVADKADERGIYCWLQASPAAHGIYLKAGFKDVGSLDVDLREFAPGGKEGGWGWGMYKFRYMLRLPESERSKQPV